MKRYHLFYVPAEFARTIESAIFQAPDDEAAIALVLEGEFSRPLELWSGYDRIKRFAPPVLADEAEDLRPV
jgi:hypothetical protein